MNWNYLIEQTVTAGGSSLSYNPATNTYTYVWKTNSGWKGQCRTLIVKLSDGTEHKRISSSSNTRPTRNVKETRREGGSLGMFSHTKDN